MLGEVSAALHRADLDIDAVAGARRRACARCCARIADGTISGKIAKDVFDAMWARRRR